MVLILTLFCLDSAALVNAALYITQPSQDSTHQGGKPCTITWVDNGEKPLLSAIGVTTIGLFWGDQHLVQNIEPLDVANTHTTTFTPLPGAGPDYDAYYLAFESTTFVGNDSVHYIGYSPPFRLTGMSGSFTSPLPAATSPISIPLFANSSTSSETRTVTVGTLSTSLSHGSSSLPSPTTTATPSYLTSTSGLSKSITPTLTSTTSSLAPTASKSGASGSASRLSGLLYVLLTIFSSAFFFS